MRTTLGAPRCRLPGRLTHWGKRPRNEGLLLKPGNSNPSNGKLLHAKGFSLPRQDENGTPQMRQYDPFVRRTAHLRVTTRLLSQHLDKIERVSGAVRGSCSENPAENAHPKPCKTRPETDRSSVFRYQ